MRFVIADDMHTPRTVVHRILQDAGHEVCAAVGNGRDAIEQTRKHKPDAVVLDVSMPGMMGDVAAKEIRKEFPDVLIFMASNITMESMRGQLESLGARFVGKPFRKEQMLNAIADALGVARE